MEPRKRMRQASKHLRGVWSPRRARLQFKAHRQEIYKSYGWRPAHLSCNVGIVGLREENIRPHKDSEFRASGLLGSSRAGEGV